MNGTSRHGVQAPAARALADRGGTGAQRRRQARTRRARDGGRLAEAANAATSPGSPNAMSDPEEARRCFAAQLCGSARPPLWGGAQLAAWLQRLKHLCSRGEGLPGGAAALCVITRLVGGGGAPGTARLEEVAALVGRQMREVAAALERCGLVDDVAALGAVLAEQLACHLPPPMARGLLEVFARTPPPQQQQQQEEQLGQWLHAACQDPCVECPGQPFDWLALVLAGERARAGAGAGRDTKWAACRLRTLLQVARSTAGAHRSGCLRRAQVRLPATRTGPAACDAARAEEQAAEGMRAHQLQQQQHAAKAEECRRRGASGAVGPGAAARLDADRRATAARRVKAEADGCSRAELLHHWLTLLCGPALPMPCQRENARRKRRNALRAEAHRLVQAADVPAAASAAPFDRSSPAAGGHSSAGRRRRGVDDATAATNGGTPAAPAASTRACRTRGGALGAT
jgi:hypothetical protein